MWFQEELRSPSTFLLCSQQWEAAGTKLMRAQEPQQQEVGPRNQGFWRISEDFGVPSPKKSWNISWNRAWRGFPFRPFRPKARSTLTSSMASSHWLGPSAASSSSTMERCWRMQPPSTTSQWTRPRPSRWRPFSCRFFVSYVEYVSSKSKHKKKMEKYIVSTWTLFITILDFLFWCSIHMIKKMVTLQNGGDFRAIFCAQTGSFFVQGPTPQKPSHFKKVLEIPRFSVYIGRWVRPLHLTSRGSIMIYIYIYQYIYIHNIYIYIYMCIWYHGQVGGFQGKEIENNEDMEKFYKPWSGSPQRQRFFGDLSFSKGFFQVKLDLWAASRGAAGCSRAQKRCHFMSNLFLECLELWLRRHIPSSESVSAKSPEVAAPRSQNQETTFVQERPFPGGSFRCRFRINSRWTIISDHFSIKFYIVDIVV